MPAPVPDDIAARARETALLLSSEVDLMGVLALEMFLTKDGRILANGTPPHPQFRPLDNRRLRRLAVRAARAHGLRLPGRLRASFRRGDGQFARKRRQENGEVVRDEGFLYPSLRQVGGPAVGAGKTGHVTVLKPLSSVGKEGRKR